MTRLPTVEEIARALAYVEREYVIRFGVIDGEQWAEGLAWHRSTYPLDSSDLAVAREIQPQLTEREWCSLAARADFMRRRDGSWRTPECDQYGNAPRYRA